MLQYERFEAILNKLQSQSSVRVTDLSRELDVSESTIRRDISDLAKAGKVRKVFGGAVPGGPMDVRSKEALQTDEKTEVATCAAALIEDGDLVYIDAGTTTGSMAEQITCKGATYVTNGVSNALKLAERGLQTYLLSGRVKPSTEAVIGHEAVGCLQKYHFNKCFIGTDGIDAESGFTTADIEESMVKSEAIRRSGDVYILADSSKFGLVKSITFAHLNEGTIITDRLPDAAFRSQTEIIELNHK